MKKILLNTFNGEKLEVDVIRYFETEGKKYLVYTLNETDADNYLRLYVGKITDINGSVSIDIISDEAEWMNVKALFKAIIAANRTNQPLPVADLRTSELTGSVLNSYRVFKLLSDMANILTEGFIDEEVVAEPTGMANSFDFDFNNIVEQPNVSNENDLGLKLEPISVNNFESMPAEPVTPAYEMPATPVEPTAFDYEMPVPTPEVADFEPSLMPSYSMNKEETGNNDMIQKELADANSRIEELMLENIDLKSKIETIKLLLK